MNHLSPFVRWALKLEYDGSAFSGWQRQKTAFSVQEAVENAASRISKNLPISSITAGRTDAGVHALGQVIHLDFPAQLKLDERTVRDGMNYHLQPHPVSILAAKQVSLEWNARFSAIERRYRYIILNRASRPVLENNRVWHVKRLLDEHLIREASTYLLGRHDFTSFRATACQARSPIRTLDDITVTRRDDHIIFDVRARSFLHHQVRNIVGTLKLVGEKSWLPEKVKTALESKDRAAAGPTAPAQGLYLLHVGYEDNPFQ